jgi:predicted amidohydrolase YtcJ
MKKHNVAYIPTMSLDDFAFAYAGFACLGKRTVLPSGTRSGRVRDDHQPPITKQKRARAKQLRWKRKRFPIAKRNLKKIYDAGILVALGTDSGATPLRVQGFAEHVELGLMVQAGLTPLQAITVATKNGALLLRVSDQYGTLEAGKKANFIVLEKDPSRGIKNTQIIRAVWKNGAKVSDGPVKVGGPE